MPKSASTQKNLHWFEVAEYGSLAGAFAGLLYQQLLCVPLLAVFIWLSQKNRRSIEEATARNIAVSTQQVHEQVSKRITAIEPTYLKASDAVTIQEQVGQLQHKLSLVDDQINQPTVSPSDLDEVKRKIEQLSEGLSAVHSLDLASLFEKMAQFQQNLEQVKEFGLQISELKTEINQFTQQIHQLEQHSTIQLQESNFAVNAKLEPISAAITYLNEQLASVTITSQDEQQKLEKLVQAISKLKHQLDHLPPAPEPFDPTSIQQEISAVGSAVQSLQQLVKDQDDKFTSEQVKRTERIASLEHQLKNYLAIKDFAAWQKKVAAPAVISIQRKIKEAEKVVVTLKEQIQTTLPKEEFVLWQQSVSSLENEVAGIKNQVAGLVDEVEGYSSSDFQTQLNATKGQVQHLKEYFLEEVTNIGNQIASLTNQVESYSKLDFQRQLEITKEQVKQLEEHLDDLDHSCQDLHDSTRSLAEIKSQLESLISSRNNSIDLEKLFQEFSDRFKGQVDESLETHMSAVNQMLKNIQPNYEYKLVSNRPESRQYFVKALDETEERLIMVCPWLATHSIDELVEDKIKAKLESKITINIGWGHLKDINNKLVKYGVGELWQRLKNYSDFYNAIGWLRDLEDDYPNLKLKIIGTHEKFIVCDRKFAVLGSHNFLTSGIKSTEREIGLYTTDPNIINELIIRFDAAKDLEYPSSARTQAGLRASSIV